MRDRRRAVGRAARAQCPERLLEYSVEAKRPFGTDCPVATPKEAIAQFRGLNRMVEDANLPRIPERVIGAMPYERPFELLGLATPHDGGDRSR